MSEWQKNLEARAKHTTAMYILEDSSGAVKAQRSAMRRHKASDMAFGFFCIMIGIAMCILAAGLYLTEGSSALGSTGFITVYLLMGVSLVIRGIAGLI